MTASCQNNLVQIESDFNVYSVCVCVVGCADCDVFSLIYLIHRKDINNKIK